MLNRFLKHYRALAKYHQSRGILQWAIKPRFHVPWSSLCWICVLYKYPNNYHKGLLEKYNKGVRACFRTLGHTEPWFASISKVFCDLNLAMYKTQYNCRFFHTYMDEDMIGTCKGLAKRVHRRLLELRLLGRFLLRLRSYRPKVVRKALICAGNGCWRVLTWPSKSHMWFPKKSRKFMFTNVASWGYGAI